jgi:hypothetical protein
MRLFCDCKTDEEKSDFFLSGRAVETGVIAPAISNDVAMAYHRCAQFKKENDALRAKIERMERQEPVFWYRKRSDGAYEGPIHNGNIEETRKQSGAWHPLYTLPGAQPAPIIPEGWKPIPEKHPTFDLVDLRLADGSVLCGCVPQSDGDYWWKGPSGEVFIDPKYASVTHWRLAAAPEAKP